MGLGHTQAQIKYRIMILTSKMLVARAAPRQQLCLINHHLLVGKIEIFVPQDIIISGQRGRALTSNTVLNLRPGTIVPANTRVF